MARTEDALRINAEFWSIYLPVEDSTLDGRIGGVLSAPWIPTVRALAEENDNVRTALQACSYAGLGWTREDPALVRYATHLYTKALREINGKLDDPVGVCGDDVLACCRLFSLFEMFGRGHASSPGGSPANDWGDHVNGTCHIVELRGAQRHGAGYGAHLYDGVRMTAVIHGLATRQPNRFTQMDWHLPTRTLRDDLFELIIPAPGLLQESDKLSADIKELANDDDQVSVLVKGEELLQRGLHVCEDLRRWELKALGLCMEHQTSPEADTREIATSDASRTLLDVCTSHGNGFFFFICTQYWAMCTTLFSSLQGLFASLSALALNISESRITQLPNWVDPEPYPSNISQVAYYFFRPEAGLWSAQSAVFPLGNALAYLARTGRTESSEFKAITKVFAEHKAGTPLRDFSAAICRRSRESVGRG